MPEPLLFDLTRGVATLTLNRPEALNAFNGELRVALRESLQQVADDPEVRAVVLVGAGRAFCAGQDLRELQERLTRDRAHALDIVAEEYNPITAAVATMPKPVVAAVGGAAAGAGAALALACDFRIMADDAAFSFAFTGVGLSSDTGAAWTLPRLVGHAKATELLMLSSKVSAERALELGMAHRVVLRHDLVKATREFARELADGPTVAFGAVKHALAFGSVHSLPETLAVEAEMQRRCGGTEDHLNAVNAFLAKERAAFRGV